ncbi:MAG: hypothetical protein DCC67_07320 [Planctomycetota bacterium]|nr:MAG: hypothetical protein DCC67_07320 [Planctomycetota bacterium]
MASTGAVAAQDVPPGQTPASVPATPDRQANPATTATPPSAPYPGSTAADDSANDDAQRKRIWNSPEMVEARQYVLEYSRRSVQFGPSQARRYLARLETLSPSEMRDWLRRFQARRAQLARSSAVARLARQQSVSQALDRIEGSRQALANISEGQTEAAARTRDRVHAQQEVADMSVAAKRVGRRNSIQWMLLQGFNPFDPTLDPAGGDYYMRQAGAAVTLPGDLIDENGNHIRGTDADIAAATPEGAAGYRGGDVPGVSGPDPGGAETGGAAGGGSP